MSRRAPSAPVPAPQAGDVLTVGELTRAVSGLLADAFPHVAVRGQVSNLRRQSSGHLYFSLKDQEAQLPCAMWRTYAQRLRFRPEDGQEVVATGRVEVYAPHGKYQLLVDSLVPMGVGELHLRYEELKRRLAAEGLFDPARKRPLPLVAERVAVLTSPTGAALQDFLRIAFRRMPRAWITVFPVRVQGEEACAELCGALEAVCEVGGFDVVVLARGGGSLEDLWCFNEEALARAVAACPVPVVSAVGHETDVTIADFVADARAATPSEAAELVFPQLAELEARCAEGRARLDAAVGRRLTSARERLDALARTHALARPVERLRRIAQDLDEWEARALAALSRRVERAGDRVARVAGHLEAVSPLAVLARGYSITSRVGAREALREAARAAVGDDLVTRLHRGEIVSRVTEIRPAEEGR